MRSVDVGSATLEPGGAKATAIDGDPTDACAVLFEDGRLETGIWECTAGAFTSRWDGIIETFHITAGAGTLTDGNGDVHELRPGVLLTIPEGSTGTWRISDTLRKSYAIVTVGANA